jgi:hypothetical protein
MTIMRERLRLLDRVVRGAADPRAIRCEANGAIPVLSEGTDGSDDVVLNVWSDHQAARYHRRACKVAKRRIKRSKEG